MKTWRIERHGGPEVLQWVDRHVPEPGAGQVLIRVEAVGLNHLDLWVRNGVPGHKFPLPLTPGCDIAGRIEAFGPGAEELLKQDGLLVGAPVVINAGISCGRCEACLSGFDPLCRHYGILGETQDGGCTEFAVVPAVNVIARPANLSAVQAAALPIPFVTAWGMIFRKAELRLGDTILIHAGGSGVSVAAIQMAKLVGAQVITTVGSDDKIAKAKALGADYVIQYQKASFRDEVKKILSAQGKRGCEVVIDHVGADTWADSMKCLAWGGKIITCGATSGAEIKIDLKAIFFKNISILGSTMGSKADFLRVVQLVAQDKLKPVIDSTFPMDQLPAALERLSKREVFGKVIVTQGA